MGLQGNAVQVAEEMADSLRMEVALRARRRRASPGFALLGIGGMEINQRLSEVEQRTRSSVSNMQPLLAFDPASPAWDMDRRSRARGIELRLLVNERTLELNPLLPSCNPGVRVGPSFIKTLIVDARAAIVEGPSTPGGQVTAWMITDGPLLDLTFRLWRLSWGSSTQALGTLMSMRQVEVARLMCLGYKDAAIARCLKISTRSVERDVEMLDTFLGAGSRPETVACIMGRGRGGGPHYLAAPPHFDGLRGRGASRTGVDHDTSLGESVS